MTSRRQRRSERERVDLPPTLLPAGTTIDEDMYDSNGVTVIGTVADIDGRPTPALLFRFDDLQGKAYLPILLMLDADRARQLPGIVDAAAAVAVEAAAQQ